MSAGVTNESSYGRFNCFRRLFCGLLPFAIKLSANSFVILVNCTQTEIKGNTVSLLTELKSPARWPTKES